ncbi:activating signal cointegrator 1 complex subunit 1 isoform X1 [Aptenodytes patagonicus]|nr:PREDICTED: activating signal cointegrator 1 complex subunit 1 isoform X2 [Aptenodytes forsteri]XP_009288836.1 PREDICTED: activating signal cointegrator 1 complex subunit 1 isoform X2 [Aptenodytes forsteri]
MVTPALQFKKGKASLSGNKSPLSNRVFFHGVFRLPLCTVHIYTSFLELQKCRLDQVRRSRMDVLRPTLIKIGGRIYRKNLIQEQAYQHEEEEEDFCAGPSDCADEPCDAFVVEETEKGFQCRVEVPSPLYKYIIGKKGETKKRLETETRTSISIPKPGAEGEIVITGQHRSGVISARTRIDVLLDSFRKKQPFTHFLSFALNQPAIQEKFLQFKEEVLEKCSKDHGVSSSLFQNPAKLHLTLGTLVLLNEQETQKACDLLQRCKEDFVDQIAGGKPLTVEVAGVEYMNDDPAMTDVLYAKVHMKDGSDRLQVIADQLVERFVASGLMLKEWDRVKLHATVMNTLFRKDPSAEERNNTMTGKSSFKERESFNGRNILKLFENFYFGEAQLDSVRLSQRFSSDASGYYATSGQLTFS